MNCRLVILALAALLLVFAFTSVCELRPSYAQAAADDSGTGWQLLRLDLDLTLRPAPGEIHGEGKVRLRLNDFATSTGPVLLLNRVGSEFIKVSVAEPTREAKTQGRFGIIRFVEPKRRGDEVEVSFEYRLAKSEQVIIEARGAHSGPFELWYPAPANQKGQSVDVDAAGSIRIHAPAGWRTLCSGRQIATHEEKGMVTENWTSSEALRWSFVAAPLVSYKYRFNDGALRVLLARPNKSKADRIANTLKRIVNALTHRLGPFPYRDYGIAEIPIGFAPFSGRSLAGFFIADESNFDNVDIDNLILAHEVSHTWWANHVLLINPGAILLTEGQAHYCVALVIEAMEGRAAALEWLRFGRVAHPRRFRAFYQGLSSTYSAAGYFNHVLNSGKDKPLVKLQGGQEDFRLAVSKGTWFFHMLRQRVGDQTFFSTLRKMIAQYGGKPFGMSLKEEQQAFLEAASADRELGSFFSQWLERPGALVLDLQIQNASGPASIEIVQKNEPFDLPLELGIDTRRGKQSQIVRLSQKQQSFSLNMIASPLVVTPDPNHRLLIWDPAFGLNPRITRAADNLYGQGEWAEAAREYEKVLERYPGAARVWFNQGYSYLRLKRYESAIEAFKHAADLNYLKATAAYNVASCYALLNKKDEAFLWLRKAIDSGFRDVNEIRTDKDLNNLRNDLRIKAFLQLNMHSRRQQE